MPDEVIAWVTGYPAHYMREFHRKLKIKHVDQIQFIYTALSEKGAAFKHEQGEIPENAHVISMTEQVFNTWKLLNKIQPTTIIINGHYPKANLIAAIWAKCYRRKLYYWADTNIQDKRHKKRSLIRSTLIDIFFYLPDTFFFIGTRNKEYYLSRISKRNNKPDLKFFPLPHNPKPFNSVSNILPSKFTFLYLGRLAKEKGVDRILEAYSLLPEKVKKHSELIVAGHGPEEEILKKLASDLKINDNVKFMGTVMSEAVPNVIASSNIVLMASDNEPWGLIVNEALSTARPVIGPSSIGAFKDLIKDQVTGYELVSSEQKLLRDAMVKAVENPEEVMKMGKAGQELIFKNEFNLDKSISVIDELLKESAL